MVVSSCLSYEMPPKPIWKLPPFASVFADQFVQGTELDGGHIVYSCQALMYALAVLTHDIPEDVAGERGGTVAASRKAATDPAEGGRPTTGASEQSSVRAPTSKANMSLYSDADLVLGHN